MIREISYKSKRFVQIVKSDGFFAALAQTLNFILKELFGEFHSIWIRPYLISQTIHYETPVMELSLITDFSDTIIITEHSKSVSNEKDSPNYGYEPGLVKAIAANVQSDTTFYDVGSRYGYYVKIVSKLGVDAKNIHSFEENPRSYGYLRRNAKNRATLNNQRVGNSENEISLDKYAEYHASPDVIKIDVDGAEYSVLQGMTEILGTDIDLFSVWSNSNTPPSYE